MLNWSENIAKSFWVATFFDSHCTHACQFWSIYLDISQNGINFSRSTYRFYHFKFRDSTSQIAMTSLLIMSGPSSPNLNPLDYQVWGNAGVLTQAATEAKTSS